MIDEEGVTLTRTFPIPAEDLYDAWADPDQVVHWYGCGFEGVSWTFHKWDATKGGEIHVDLEENGEVAVTIRGKFLVAERPHRLVYSWHGDEQIAVDLEPTAGGTKLTLVHRNLPVERLAMVNVGWSAGLEALTRAATQANNPSKTSPTKTGPKVR